MRGNMKVWIVVATWVWWNAVVGQAWMCPLMLAEQHTTDYRTVNFTTEDVTNVSYSQFIEAMRKELASGVERHGIPIMRNRSTVLRDGSKWFLLVNLSNWESESPVTLALNVTNAYVVAYRTEKRSFFLNETNPDPAMSKLFPSTQRHPLRFSGSYIGLEHAAGATREKIELGMTKLDVAITSLRISKMDQQRNLARSLIVVIQMIAEAVRFKYIEQRVLRSIPTTFLPDPGMCSLENNWGALSNAVQQSSKEGIFSRPIRLFHANGDPFNVSSVRHEAIKGALKIMPFSCKLSRSKSRRASSDQFIIEHLLMMTMPVCVVGTDVDVDEEEVNDNDDTCADPEPTVRISGRDGLCIDVRDERYSDGNPIQLWSCKDQLDANQLWTLRKDGTIRSNGSCLTTYGYSPGSYVMIYDCTTAVTAATRWQVWDDGTIINPESALVLSANPGDSGTTLTVQTNIYASRQGWLAGNNTEPFITSIVGFNNLCMQANGSAMWVVECQSNNTEQKWALYADGSIRPQQNQDRCLTSSDNHSQGSIIIISSCSPGSEGQRWVFMNDSTILNLNNRMVMDVKRSDPNLHQIIIWPFTGNPNQKWLPLY